MNPFRAILIQALAATCIAATPVVCHAANAPAAAAPCAVAGTNASATNVPRPPRRLEEDELRSLLAAALNQRRGEDGGEWEVRLTRPWTPITVPDELLTMEIVEPSFNRITSSCILRFELRAGQKTVGSWQAQVQARCWRQTLVAHASLRRGQLLREDDFARERCDVLTLREPLANLPPQGATYELAETVPAGAPLTARAIRLKPVLARGQMADAIIRDGAMIISLKVEVLEEGVPGQIVRVRNPQSHRELRGKVFDEQTVEIPL
jgi:flagella basal body P-ring formation protein FlgA